MDSQLVWQDSFNIGVEAIDKEHQQLFKIINRLFEYGEEKSRWACQEGVKYFKSHTMKHFEDEEAYMASIGYEGLETHRHIHKEFRENTLPVLEQELEETDYNPDSVNHFLGVCAGWLIGHTMTEDQAITGGRSSQWRDLLVYYRLVYGAKGDEKRQEVIMVFEEKLLLNTVGKVLGLQTNKLDSMLINAARYTARQFVGRVMELVPAFGGQELREENLLSYEQFRKVFEREKPQVSLLFNTSGAGYFAYCVIAPHLLESGVGTPIEADNAMTEIQDYLAKREEASGKRRVLVVDDSATVRQAMKVLLEKDYEVSLAESGVAAIRTITLDRPDMVLLDYEMPVCDGRQTLEMLRSDPAFADLPVVFLTGRGDPDVVRKLLSLKPMGYLLKYLKPEEIKKKIDGFFEKLA